MSVYLAGPNWAINCSDDQDTCETLQSVLGGELRVADFTPDLTDAGSFDPDQPVGPDKLWGSVANMLAAVEARGAGCKDWFVEPEPVGFAQETATCTVGISFSTYVDSVNAESGFVRGAGFASTIGKETHWLVGPDWTVNCWELKGLCLAYETVFGGELRSHQP